MTRLTDRLSLPQADPCDFSPPLIRLQDSPPSPLGRRVLYVLFGLLAALLLWSVVGRLDIVAVAEGKLVPQSFLKIVQPAESGIVREILVREGQAVAEGQVLMRMDALISEADRRTLEADFQRKTLTLGRIDAELGQGPFKADADAPAGLAREIEAQYRANRAALEAALAEEQAKKDKARREMAVAQQVKAKLAEILPHYRTQDAAFEKLSKDGFAGPLMASDKKRERIEKEQELVTQEHVIASANASIAQSEKRLAQIVADHRRQLYAERNEVQGQVDKLVQERTKQAHRQGLLELRASQAGVVKDIATHTAGTVVQPGTVLLTLVPQDDVLRAEVWVSNQDIGFVRAGQPVKVKLAAFPFQKYGMVEGTVEHVSADAADGNAQGPQNGNGERSAHAAPLAYRALVALRAMQIGEGNERLPLAAGMQASAEILLGTRSVLEYLLSPVQKAWHEAGRER
ncbi:MAG: HlyD family type I secretion periplasmic adaptor subunit [Rhodocyclaceae bacterium]|jgi:HlyD family secretion protein|nr:HlyD family type I secretion periplasmic adaptor subunit [Rhodocyclaceae bacterium]MCO5097139.1 HlyD family type I secretion periplasmic adaptor subunit [Rhodocyclaceae bacterium]